MIVGGKCVVSVLPPPLPCAWTFFLNKGLIRRSVSVPSEGQCQAAIDRVGGLGTPPVARCTRGRLESDKVIKASRPRY